VDDDALLWMHSFLCCSLISQLLWHFLQISVLVVLERKSWNDRVIEIEKEQMQEEEDKEDEEPFTSL